MSLTADLRTNQNYQIQISKTKGEYSLCGFDRKSGLHTLVYCISPYITQEKKDIKTKRLYVVYTGPDKQRRQENLKTLKTSF
jgi:hypothetical protein